MDPVTIGNTSYSYRVACEGAHAYARTHQGAQARRRDIEKAGHCPYPHVIEERTPTGWAPLPEVN